MRNTYTKEIFHCLSEIQTELGYLSALAGRKANEGYNNKQVIGVDN